MKPALKLYQFPISHFCEKVRWALDFKQLDYETINWLPGLHIRSAKKLGCASNVPILQHDKQIIQGSAQIIDYLEEHFPSHPLNFDDNAQTEEAKSWERFADEQIGPHVRRIIYHDLLNHPDICIPLLGHNSPWYGSYYLKIVYPKLTNIMRKAMKINDKEVLKSKETLAASLSHLADTLSQKQTEKPGEIFLVGERFSRAELAIAALLAPLFLASNYGLDWPEVWPTELQNMLNHYQPKLVQAKSWYDTYRLC